MSCPVPFVESSVYTTRLTNFILADGLTDLEGLSDVEADLRPLYGRLSATGVCDWDLSSKLGRHRKGRWRALDLCCETSTFSISDW